MHHSFRIGFEKSAGNDPVSDPDTDVLTMGGNKIISKTMGVVARELTHSRPIAKATSALANQFLQQKRLEDDMPQATAPQVQQNEGVF